MSGQGRGALKAALWLLVVYAALVHVTRHTWRLAVRDYQILDTPPLANLDTRLIDLLIVGHRGLYDDLLAIWTLQTLLDHRVAHVSPEELQRSVLKVTRHSPQIESLYTLSCYVLSLDMKRADLCDRITADGLKALPTSWKIPMIQGYLYYAALKNPENAAMYYGLAASKPDSPEFLKKLALNLVQKNQLDPSELDASLEAVLPKATSERVFQNILQRDRSSPPDQDKR